MTPVPTPFGAGEPSAMRSDRAQITLPGGPNVGNPDPACSPLCCKHPSPQVPLSSETQPVGIESGRSAGLYSLIGTARSDICCSVIAAWSWPIARLVPAQARIRVALVTSDQADCIAGPIHGVMFPLVDVLQMSDLVSDRPLT